MAEKTERLIETIRSYPVLYDTTHDDYKNKHLKDKIWDKIAEALRDVGGGDALKSKWKNLRDSYGKYLRAQNETISANNRHVERYKTWPWGTQMEFLQPYLEFAGSNSHSKNSRSINKSRRMHASPDPLIDDTYVTQSHESDADRVISYFAKRDQNNSRADIADLDETDLIFLGYARTIKKMKLQRQATLKFEIAKLIMEAEVEQAQESCSSVPDLKHIIIHPSISP
ncbi:transcription factor Adf-1 [Helicoverpa armigera]|uniref:transcription factor Adf-1 n=1 Tax=Helicoverpa armigera TaxID=29058 RepID=UPI003082E5E7